MTIRPGLAAAAAAALMLAACDDAYTPSQAGGSDAAITDDMIAPDPMLSAGEIDDATGTEIP